jgi:tRNA (guanine-N7-)-methyltransferase
MATLLPRLRLAQSEDLSDLAAAFAHPVGDVWLEIGFGGGEHLVSQALSNPRIGFIGCEPFINGVAKVVAAVADGGIANVRIHDADAALLLPRLPHGSIGRVSLLFPDPWPKRRQRKRRFVGDASLAALARVMRPGAELRFATDWDDYAAWTLASIARSPDFEWPAETADAWRRPWASWPGTRYEAKAVSEGRRPVYLTFRRR